MNAGEINALATSIQSGAGVDIAALPREIRQKILIEIAIRIIERRARLRHDDDERVRQLREAQESAQRPPARTTTQDVVAEFLGSHEGRAFVALAFAMVMAVEDIFRALAHAWFSARPFRQPFAPAARINGGGVQSMRPSKVAALAVNYVDLRLSLHPGPDRDLEPFRALDGFYLAAVNCMSSNVAADWRSRLDSARRASPRVTGRILAELREQGLRALLSYPLLSDELMTPSCTIFDFGGGGGGGGEPSTDEPPPPPPDPSDDDGDDETFTWD